MYNYYLTTEEAIALTKEMRESIRLLKAGEKLSKKQLSQFESYSFLELEEIAYLYAKNIIRFTESHLGNIWMQSNCIKIIFENWERDDSLFDLNIPNEQNEDVIDSIYQYNEEFAIFKMCYSHNISLEFFEKRIHNVTESCYLAAVDQSPHFSDRLRSELLQKFSDPARDLELLVVLWESGDKIEFTKKEEELKLQKLLKSLNILIE